MAYWSLCDRAKKNSATAPNFTKGYQCDRFTDSYRKNHFDRQGLGKREAPTTQTRPEQIPTLSCTYCLEILLPHQKLQEVKSATGPPAYCCLACFAGLNNIQQIPGTPPPPPPRSPHYTSSGPVPKRRPSGPGSAGYAPDPDDRP